MTGRHRDLNRMILAALLDGKKTIPELIDAVLEKIPEGITPSDDTIRRRVYKLGAGGYVSQKQEIVLCLTAKGRERNVKQQ